MKSKFLLALTIFITGLSLTEAQVITTFKPRYQVTQKGGIVFLSNVATTCFVADTNSLPPSTGTTNNSLPSLYVDRDNDATTFSSTSDSLNLPTCSEISFVGLYWGGNATSSTVGWATKDQIKIKANNGTYVNITADSLITNSIGFTTYHCFKDITAIVKTAGLNARWTVANVIGETNQNNKFAGWNMIVVYKNDLQNMRQLTVFNGLAVVNTATVDIPVSGFLTPPTGPVTFEMGLYCYDGDRSTTGDALSFSGTGPFVAVSDAINAANNAFNSTIGRNGVLTSFRKPNYSNNFSIDADIFIPDNSAKNYIGNSATSCVLRQTTSGDVYLTQAVTFAIDVYSPDVRTAVSVQDINGGSVQPGDTLQYTVIGKNIGSDPSINTFITDSIEANADYIPGSITITAGPNLGLKTDGTGDDQAEYLSATKTVRVRIGTGADGTTGGQVNDSPFGTDSTTFTFLVKVSSDCYKIACDNVINNSALITGTGITSGISYTNASNPGIFDAFGCPIPGATTTPINSSSCVAPPDTSIEVCNSPSAPAFTSIYSRPGYVFYNSGGTVVTSPSVAGNYYAVYTAYTGCSDTVNITITVKCNIPPVLDNETNIINEDTQASSDLTNAGDTDPDGTALTVNVIPVSGPTNGGIIINADGTYTYTPNANFNGVDMVVVEICDNGIPLPAACVNDTIFITINPVNDLPLANDDNGPSLTEDGANGTVNVITNDTDADGNPTAPVNGVGQFTVDLDPGTVGVQTTLTDVQGVWTLNTATGVVTFDAADNYNGTAVIPYTLCDPSGACDNANITFVVDPVNDLPVANDDNGSSLTEDGANGTVTVITNDTDADGNPTAPVNGVGQFTVDLDPGTAGIQTTWTDAQGVWTLNTATGEVTFDPADDYNGTAVIPYTLCDSSGACDNANITFVVNAVNDLPVVDNEFHTIPQDAIATGDLTDAGDTDPDGTVLTATSTPLVAPLHGTITINSDGTYSYDADLGYVGTDLIVVQICDAGTPLPAVCVDDTIFITTTSTNAPPTAVDDNSYSTNEDITLSGSTVLVNDIDPDNNINPVSVTLVSGTADGSLTLNADGTFSYTPDSDFNGTDQFTYSMCDLGFPVYCDTAVVSIIVNAVNDLPVLDNEFHIIAEDGSASGDLTDAGDVDPDGTALTATSVPVVAPANGVVVINANGTYTYTPDADFYGADLVVVEICDAGIPAPPACVNDTIFITVTPVNDPPVLDNETHIIDEDTPATGDLTDGGDSDPDGTSLTATTTPVVAPANGVIVINADGTYTYTPNTDFNGTDWVVVQVCDAGIPGIECVSDTIFLTVNALNDTPVANDDTDTTDEDTPVNGDVSPNDNDVDGLSVIITGVNPPANGTILLNGDGTYTYTPNANFNGNDTVTYSYCDGGNPDICDTAILVITVNPLNDPPLIDNETHILAEDTQATGDLTDGGDSDPDGTSLTATTTPVVAPANGSIVINTDGTYLYTPDVNYNGTDLVVVEICDAGIPGVECINDTIFITVNAVNNTPVANDDTNSTNEDTPVNGNVSPNDTDVDGPSVNITEVIPPSHGSITLNTDGTYTYTPDANYNGVDTVVYSYCDGGTPDLCDTAILVITVNAVNDGPVANDDTNSTNEDTPVNGDVSPNDTDVDGPSVNITEVIPPSHGSITLNTDGTYTYTPDANYSGVDTVVYSYCDGGTPDLCDTAILVITVNAVNDGPVANDDTNSTNEDTPVNGDVSPNDSDVDGPSVNITEVTPPSHGSVTLNTDGTYTYTPDANYNGVDTVVYSYCDGGTPDLCDTAILVITVNAVNDGPVANDDTNSTNEDTPVTGDVSPNDSDVDGPSVNITEVTPPSHGSITLNADGTYNYQPAAGFNGVDTVVYSYCDGGTPDLCDTAILVITINSINDQPNIDQVPLILPEDSTITFCPALSDPDAGDLLTVSFCGGPYGGTASLTGNCINYTPNANFNGLDSLCLFVCDNGSPVLCDTILVAITVTPANDSPVAQDDINSTAEETPVNGTVATNDNDIDGPAVNDTPVSGPANGLITLSADGSYTYTPNTGFNGNDTVVYSYCDGGNPDLCDTAILVITVTPVNDAPGIDQVPLLLPEDSVITFCPVLSDPDAGDVLSVSICGGPYNGNAVTAANCITYTPDANYNGDDSICLIVCDNGTPVLCDTVVVLISVTPVNDKPVANDDAITTVEETPVTITVLANDSDVEGGLNNPTVISQPANGAVVVNADGTLTYTPDNGFNGVDTFIYAVCDTSLPSLCDTAVVIVTVNPQNDAPLAADDNIITAEDSPITINVLANDSDPEGNIDPNPSVIDNPENGIVTVNADGTITYTPNPNYNGLDSFTYVICDSAGLCDTAKVFVTVTPAPDAPVVVPVPLVTDEDVSGTQCFSFTTDDNLDSVSVSVLCPALNGTVDSTYVNNGQICIAYTPNQNYNGSDSTCIQVCDLSNGLCVTVTVPITVNPKEDPCYWLKGISPNGDNQNDNFWVNCNDEFPDATLRVFNRWGDEVWRSDGHYNNDWYGRNMKDQNLPDGTYYYVYEYNKDGKKGHAGFVTINR